MADSRRSMPTRVLLKRFIPYFYKYKWLLFADLLAASLTTVCELVLPLIVRRITNGALGTAGALTTGLVLRMGALYILLRIVDAGANYYMQSEGHIMGAKIETDMRHDLFHHLQQLSFSFYSSTKIGQIMSRLTSDLFDITEFAHHAPENFLISGIKVIIAFIILSGMNIWLTLLIFAVLPFMIYFTRFFNRKMRIAFMESRHQVGEINAQVDDSGIYRLDAFDENGRMVASMDITARVLDPEVPQAGDRTLPVPLVLAAMGLAAATLLALRRRNALN